MAYLTLLTAVQKQLCDPHTKMCDYCGMLRLAGQTQPPYREKRGLAQALRAETTSAGTELA